jgi:hypothetical protein
MMVTVASPLPERAGDVVPFLLAIETESQLTLEGMTTFQSPVATTDTVYVSPAPDWGTSLPAEFNVTPFVDELFGLL